MSLSTDKFFYDSLRESADIIEVTDGRIFNPAREDIDEEKDKIPYIILALEGVQNQAIDEDTPGEGRVDTDTISVLCVAQDRGALADMTELVRSTLRTALNKFGDIEEQEYGFAVTNYTFSAGPVQFDGGKPCCFQTLTYSVENEIY